MIIKLLIILAFCLLFWLGYYKNTGTDEKNLLGFRSYPDEIQNMIYRNENLSKKVPAGINMLKVVISNIVVFAVIFGIIGAILKYTPGMVEKHLKNPFFIYSRKRNVSEFKKTCRFISPWNTEFCIICPAGSMYIMHFTVTESGYI